MAVEWSTVPLGDVVENLDRFRVPVSGRDRRPGPYPYYGAAGVQDWVDGWLFEGLHLLVAEDGTVENARGGLVLQLPNGRFWVNNHAHVLKARIDSDTRFLYYALHTVAAQPFITGAVQQKISQSNLNRIHIRWPDAGSRERITSILGALDDKIELNRRMNETLEAMAQAVFKEWFTKSDRVQDWRQGRLSDVLTLQYGKSLPKRRHLPGDIPVYGSGGIYGHHEAASVEHPTVIVGRKGTVGSLYWESRPSHPADTVFFVEPKAPLTYCYYLLQTLGLDSMNTDAAVPGLNRENAYRLEVPVPPEELLADFDAFAQPIRDRVDVGHVENQTLAAIRDTLLPKLISGELRIPDAERLVSEVT